MRPRAGSRSRPPRYRRGDQPRDTPRKLLGQGLERELFERLVGAAREAALLAKDAEQLVDSSHVLGAAGVQDTYTLLRGGIKKLLRALANNLALEGTRVVGWPPESDPLYQNIPYIDSFVIIWMLNGTLKGVQG